MKPAKRFRAAARFSRRSLIGVVITTLLSAAPAFGSEPNTETSAEAETADKTGAEVTEGKKTPELTLDERLDALLMESGGNEYSEPQRCLNVRSYRRVKVLSTKYLLFSRGDVYWLNKLKRPCQSLKWNDLPVFESRGTSSHCQNDIFYATSSMDLQQGLDPTGRPRGTHGICYLGAFEQITAEQAVLLKEQ